MGILLSSVIGLLFVPFPSLVTICSMEFYDMSSGLRPTDSAHSPHSGSNKHLPQSPSTSLRQSFAGLSITRELDSTLEPHSIGRWRRLCKNREHLKYREILAQMNVAPQITCSTMSMDPTARGSKSSKKRASKLSKVLELAAKGERAQAKRRLLKHIDEKVAKNMAQGLFDNINLKVDSSSIDAMRDLLSSINVSVKHSISLPEQFREALSKILSVEGLTWSLVAIVSLLFILHNKFGTKGIFKTKTSTAVVTLGVILSMILTVYSDEMNKYLCELIRVIVSTFSRDIPECFTKPAGIEPTDSPVEAQGLFSGSTLTTMFGAAVLAYSIKGSRDRNDDPMKMMLKAAATAPAIKAFSSVADWFAEAIQHCISTMCIHFGIPALPLFESKAPDVSRYLDRVDELLKRVRSSKETLTMTLANEVEALDCNYRLLVKKYTKDAAIRSAMATGFKLLDPLRVRLERANLSGSAPRAQPFSMLIYGPPGVGKSKTMGHLARELAALVCTEAELALLRENANALYYFRNVATEYFDGYYGQPFIFYDEMAQCHADLLTRANDIFEFIGMANTVPYMVHMADIENKGAIYARPRAIFATTNEASFDNSISRVINTPEAFRRRWTLSVVLVPKKEYCVSGTELGSIIDRRLDEMKLKEGFFNENVHEFYFWDFKRGRLDSPKSETPLSYSEMLELSFAEYVKFHNSQAAAAHSLTDAVVSGEAKRSDMHKKYSFDANVQAQGLFSTIGSVKTGLERQVSTYCRRGLQRLVDLASDNVPFPKVYADIRDAMLIPIVCEDSTQYVAQLQADMASFLMDHLKVDTSTALDIVLRLSLVDFSDMEKRWPEVLKEYRRIPASAGWSTLLDSSLTWLENMRVKFGQFLQDNPRLKQLLCVGAAVSVLWFGIVKLFGDSDEPVWKRFDEDGTPVPQYSSDTRVERKARKPKARVHSKNVKYRGYTAQMNSPKIASNNIMMQMIRMIKTNMYSFRVGVDGDVAGFAFFVKDQIAMMPRHFMDGMLESFDNDPLKAHFTLTPCFGSRATITIYYRDCQTCTVSPESDDGSLDESDDVEFVRIPCGQTHVDWVSRFVSEKDMPPQEFSVSLYKTFGQSIAIANSDARMTTTRYRDNFDNHFYLSRCVEYAIPTTVGDCGSLVVRCDKVSANPVVVGIHVAGSGDTGFANVVTREMVEEVLNTFAGRKSEPVIRHDVAPQMNYASSTRPVIKFQPHPVVSLSPEEVYKDYTVVGVANVVPDKELRDPGERTMSCSTRTLGITDNPNPSPNTTSLTPTVFQGMQGALGVPMKKVPAPLRTIRRNDGSVINPMAVARDGYSVACPLYDLRLAEHMVRALAHHMYKQSMDMPTFSPWNWDQVFMGIEGNKFAKALNRSTSAGWPYGMWGSTKAGKKPFFGHGSEFELDNVCCTKLVAELETLEDKYANNEITREVFTDFLKDELRSIEKAETGQTRLVSCAPLSLTCLIRKYFMPIMVYFFENRIRNSMGPGINPYGMDWHRLATRILEKIGSKTGVWAGDYKGWDKTIPSSLMQLLWPFFEFFMSNYSEREKAISRNLLLLVCNSFHLFGDTLYRWSGSMSSGVAFTTFANSILNLLVIMLAMFDIEHGEVDYTHDVDPDCVAHEAVASFMSDFEQKCYLCTFGDDNLIAVDTDLVKYSPSDLVNSVAKLGFTLIDESKTGSIGDWKGLDEVTFLKRGFFFDRRIRQWIAPLEMDSILQSFFWKSAKVPDVEWAESTYAHLCELALHSPEIFNKYYPKYVGVLKTKFKFLPPSDDYNVIRREVLRRTEFY